VQSYGDKALVELQKRVKYCVRVDELDLDCDGTSDLTASFAAVQSSSDGVDHVSTYTCTLPLPGAAYYQFPRIPLWSYFSPLTSRIQVDATILWQPRP
jgi:hypothetical protein